GIGETSLLLLSVSQEDVRQPVGGPRRAPGQSVGDGSRSWDVRHRLRTKLGKGLNTEVQYPLCARARKGDKCPTVRATMCNKQRGLAKAASRRPRDSRRSGCAEDSP